MAFVVLLLSLGVEFLASYLGAQKVGASNWSQIGLVVGLLAGIFGLLPALPIGGPIIGLFVGPVVGAFVGEYAYRRDLELTPRLQQSLKVCVGIVVGTVIGHVAKAMLATAAVIVFIVTIDSLAVFQFSFCLFVFNSPSLSWPFFLYLFPYLYSSFYLSRSVYTSIFPHSISVLFYPLSTRRKTTVYDG